MTDETKTRIEKEAYDYAKPWISSHCYQSRIIGYYDGATAERERIKELLKNTIQFTGLDLLGDTGRVNNFSKIIELIDSL